MKTTTQTIEATKDNEKVVIVTFSEIPTYKEINQAFENGADVVEL